MVQGKFRMWRPNRQWVTVAAMILALSGQAHAQSDDTLMLMNRLNDLEAQVQQLKRGGGGAPQPSGGYPAMAPGGAGPGGAADLDVRISQLQEQVRNLTGELETQNNEIAQMRTENQRLNQDMQMRLNDVEAKVGGGPPAGAAPTSLAGRPGMGEGEEMYGPAHPSTPPPTPPPAGGSLGTVLVPGPDGAVPASSVSSPEKDYELAYNQLGQGDYGDAETGFSSFLQHYPRNPLASNAKYWLGETYFQRGMNDRAATVFAESYKQYPNGPKAPDSLLRLGMSLGQANKAPQACIAFAELAKQFPAATPKIRTQLAQERSRYGCQ